MLKKPTDPCPMIGTFRRHPLLKSNKRIWTMGPIRAVGRCYARTLNFSDRASRAEYWWFSVFQVVLYVGGFAGLFYWTALQVQNDPAFATLMQSPGGSEAYFGSLIESYFLHLSIAYLFVTVLPLLAVTVRRLHDTDRSGWWYWFQLVPLIGPIWLLVLMCLPGTHGTNRFGGDPVANRAPKEPAHPAFAAELEGEERDRSEVARRAAARDYYKRRVLPSIQKA
jgi:uncharacterized membrane protein YhaH (DUF805 family)